MKAGNAAGPPTFSASVAGTAPPMSPPTGVEVAGPLPVCVLVRTGNSAVWSIVPVTSAARGPEANTGTVAPVWDCEPAIGAVP